ncbi:mechanosensitive ion channel domain-containing protein [Caminibacter pacificus]|uniref:Mechanosensitive ion channel n=1 Tax=Caminibacter pacificus TaxID=1424653 RepID=A0AAJ4RCY6_9BACT|nr:mechanosensitive ion channel domain-containing protein [Caminibacter pacificus]QCI27687.1 mechanosensitive ion channel [Caminibacter pacificus]ROR40138.1 mechanosensitive ion channel-like protein [Caminibacter pacificus]
MRFLLIFFVLLNFVFAQNVDEILEKIPKNSPTYSLDVALAKKIKTLKFKPYEINLSPKNQVQYLKSFKDLISMQEDFITLPKKIDDLNEKISLLKEQNSTTSDLQKLYYSKLLGIYNKQYEYLSQNLKKIKKTLFEKLKNIKFDIQEANENIAYWNKLLKQKQLEYEKLKIDLQKWQLLGDEKNIQKIQNYIKINLQKKEEIYKHLFDNHTVLWLEAIKNKDKKALKLDDNVLNDAKHIGDIFYKAVDIVVNDFESFAFGSKLLVYNSKKELQLTLDKIWQILNYPLFTVGKRTITPINFFIFVLVLILGWFVGKYYKKFVYSLRHRYEISHATATLLANMGYYTIITLSFLIALKIVGLDLSSLAIIAGALSVGIGFGLQNIVSNFVSGIILMFERSIKVGDYIQIDENTRGEVVDISMRSTIIRTNDNINLIIPNQSFIQNNVINWTLGDDLVRFRVPFGVAYGSDIDKVEKVVLGAIENAKLHYIKKHPTLDVTPRVVFLEMGDSSLNFELMVWVKGAYARRPRRTRSEFLKVIYKALNNAGIEIPFPQQDLHIRDSVPIEIRVKKEDKQN